MSRERLLRAVAYFFTIPGQFRLNAGQKAQNPDKTKRPAGVFHKIFSNILEKRRQLQMRFTRCFLLHDREERQRRCPATLPLLNSVSMQSQRMNGSREFSAKVL